MPFFMGNRMTKNKENIGAAELLLNILERIPKNRKITVKELLAQLKEIGVERDERSIQRHLKKLTEMFDIECDDRSKPYGYRWKERSVGLALPALTEAQSLVLLMAENQLKNVLPSNIMASMSSFFEQAKYNLIYNSKNKLSHQWLDKVDIVPMDQPLIPARIDLDIFNQISTALFHNKYLNIEYRNVYNKIHKAKIMPLALVHQEARSYLIACYPDYNNDINHLALHRFIRAEVSTMTFERPADFNLKKYKDAEHFAYGEGNKIILTFYTTKENGYYLLETPLSEDQTIVESTEKYYKFQASVINSMLLDWWIAKFGEDIWGVEKKDIIVEVD